MEEMKIPNISKFRNNIAEKIVEDIFNCQPMNRETTCIFRTDLCTPEMFKKSEPKQRIVITNPFEQRIYDFIIKEFGDLNDFVVYHINDITWNLCFEIDGWNDLIDENKKIEISKRYMDGFDQIFKPLFDNYKDGDMVVYYDNIIPLSGRAGFLLIRETDNMFNIVSGVILKMS